jgi:tetratricopeptide (TPR) repeat protein
MQAECFKTIICLAVFTWFAGIGAANAQQDNIEEMRRHIRYAQTAYNRSEYPNALAEYQEALKLAPNYPELYKAIGDVYEKLATSDDLRAAITHYKFYVELAPNASDVRQIQDKIYDLEYVLKQQKKQEVILDDLSGEWVAIDNIEVYKIEYDGKIQFDSDFVFQITEIQKTGKYRIEMLPSGNRYYSDNLIEKTVNIVPAKDNSFTFTFADAVAHTPKSSNYDMGRLLGRMIGTATKSNWVGDMTDIAINAAQESDLPSNTQTAYTFALKYDEGRLVGMVNIIGKFSDPTKQQTTGNKLYEITFVKKDDKFREMLNSTLNSEPEIINAKTFKDKWGKKLSNKEIANRLYSFNPQLGKKYYRARNTEMATLIMLWASIPVMLTGEVLWLNTGVNPKLKTKGQIMFLSSLAVGITCFSVGMSTISKKSKLIREYNDQITQQHKNKPTAELRFGTTSSGGVGLTLNF